VATDPSQLLLQIANAPGLAAQSVFDGANNGLAYRQGKQQIQVNDQNMQINRLKMAALQQEQGQEEAFQGAVQQYLTAPTPGSLSALMARFPDKADALKKSWDVKDHAVRAADMGQFGAIYSALDNGKTDLAIGQLRQRRDAEKAQGIDTTDLDHYLEALQTGDKAAINTVKGFALAQLAAGDSDKFSEIFKTVGGDRGSKVVGPGAALVDGEGKELYKAPFAPRPVTVGEGDTVVEYQPGGGGPASGGGSSGAYTGGWTPRARNGGDNNDAAVDGKIAGAAQYLGVGPGDDISGLSPMKIAQAMTLSEGGAGSIADRNNNPGNLRNGDGSFKKFPTKEAGLRAAAALVSRKLRNGQTTVTSLIEGVPQSGGGGGARVIAQGAPKPGYHLMTPEENQAAGLDPNVRYQRSPDGQITALGGQSKAQLKPVPAPIVTKVLDNRKAVRNIDGALAAVKDYPDGVGLVVGTMPNWVAQRYDKKGVDVRSAIANIGSLLIHDRSGAAVTISETPRLLPFIPQVSDPPSSVEKKLKRLRAEIASLNEDYEAQYSEDQGYKPIAASPSAAPVRVRSMQEAQKLAPGTVYVAPNGQRYRR
jgi:hypothetical protein